jgi:hypothetical protein
MFIMPKARDNIKKGIFSIIIEAVILFLSTKSSSKSITGRVTAIGFANNERVNKNKDNIYKLSFFDL